MLILAFCFCLFLSVTAIPVCLHAVGRSETNLPIYWTTYGTVYLDDQLLIINGFTISENYHGSNTVYLVITLMSVVGGVFVVFAMMALCYRSVVVHKNFSLCLRLVCRNIHVEDFLFAYNLLHLAFYHFIA